MMARVLNRNPRGYVRADPVSPRRWRCWLLRLGLTAIRAARRAALLRTVRQRGYPTVLPLFRALDCPASGPSVCAASWIEAMCRSSCPRRSSAYQRRLHLATRAATAACARRRSRSRSIYHRLREPWIAARSSVPWICDHRDPLALLANAVSASTVYRVLERWLLSAHCRTAPVADSSRLASGSRCRLRLLTRASGTAPRCARSAARPSLAVSRFACRLNPHSDSLLPTHPRLRSRLSRVRTGSCPSPHYP
jgi:hypothetical protein